MHKPAGVAEVLEGLCADVARDAGLELEDMTATWEEIDSGHFAAGGSASDRSSGGSHPLLVDVLLADSQPAERAESIIQAAAASLAARGGIPIERVFVNARYARSGMVFDKGEIVRW